MMKSRLKTLLVVAVALAASASSVRAESYMIDPSHTSIIFGVSHLKYSFTYGRFNKMRGSYVLDRADPAASKFQIIIDAASLDTNDDKRDMHLRSPDFFNTNEFPVISFQSTGVSLENTDKGEVYNITGNMTMHGTTRQVMMPLRKLGEGKGPYGKYRTGFYGDQRIKRSEYGMTNMIDMIGDEVAVTISFEGIRQNTPEGSSSAMTAVPTPAGPTPAGSSTNPGSDQKAGSDTNSGSAGSETR